LLQPLRHELFFCQYGGSVFDGWTERRDDGGHDVVDLFAEAETGGYADYVAFVEGGVWVRY
jgi:hypothetical protein